jgi:hypothetical protein
MRPKSFVRGVSTNGCRGVGKKLRAVDSSGANPPNAVEILRDINTNLLLGIVSNSVLINALYSSSTLEPG